MKIIYSDHAKKRMRERNITEEEVEYILKSPEFVKKDFNNKREAVGHIKNRKIKIVFVKENYIKIITVI